MEIKAVLYVEDVFNITGRGPVAACHFIWDNGAKCPVKVGDQAFLLRLGRTGLAPFTIRGIEMGSGSMDRQGFLIPSDLEVPHNSHILVME